MLGKSGSPRSFLPAKGKTSKNVSKGYNKSGVALTGPGSSGTLDYKDLPTPGSGFRSNAKATTGLSKGRHPAAYSEPGGSGRGVPSGTIKIGSGDTTRYVEYAPHKDRSGTTTPSASSSSSSRSDSAPAGTGTRGNPSRPVRESPSEATSSLASNLVDKKNKGEMTINDFMAIAKASGKRNSYNRGYQMWKNYQATGKLPQHRVGPDK